MTAAPEPFRVDVPDETLADLRERLARTRWPDQIEGYGWRQGAELGAVQRYAAYWADGYDWRAAEAGLNRLRQFTAPAGGLRVHFVHERSPHPDALPLLLQHGWPGSFFEFHRIVGMLTHPERHGGEPGDAFHVVAPSLPGYAFSEAPREPGMHPGAIGEIMHALMHDVLGYERYGAQGGDWGALVASAMALRHPESVVGLHLNMQGYRAKTGGAARPLDDEEKAWLGKARAAFAEDMAYFAIQGTRPTSLGYGLHDSPVGLLGWFLEKFTAWTDCGGVLENAVPRDDFLTNLMLYWATGSIASAARIYYEHLHTGGRGVLAPGERVEVPTAMAVFPREILVGPRQWVERAYDVVRWTEMPRGGHFAALEQPELLAADVRAFFRDRRRPR